MLWQRSINRFRKSRRWARVCLTRVTRLYSVVCNPYRRTTTSLHNFLLQEIHLTREAAITSVMALRGLRHLRRHWVSPRVLYLCAAILKARTMLRLARRRCQSFCHCQLLKTCGRSDGCWYRGTDQYWRGRQSILGKCTQPWIDASCCYLRQASPGVSGVASR